MSRPLLAKICTLKERVRIKDCKRINTSFTIYMFKINLYDGQKNCTSQTRGLPG